MTPLMYAAREGRLEIVQLLLDNGAEIDRQDTRGWTVSHPLCFPPPSFLCISLDLLEDKSFTPCQIQFDFCFVLNERERDFENSHRFLCMLAAHCFRLTLLCRYIQTYMRMPAHRRRHHHHTPPELPLHPATPPSPPPTSPTPPTTHPPTPNPLPPTPMWIATVQRHSLTLIL